MISISKIVPAAVFVCLSFLCASVILAENTEPTLSTGIFVSQSGDNIPASTPAVSNPPTEPGENRTQSLDAPKTEKTSFKFKRYDFENSVCFKKCHQVSAVLPSKKTEQQWRMLIEKNGHDIFETIVWEYPGQKDQVLMYLIEHAGGSGDEGIGFWN